MKADELREKVAQIIDREAFVEGRFWKYRESKRRIARRRADAAIAAVVEACREAGVNATLYMGKPTKTSMVVDYAIRALAPKDRQP